MQAISKIKNHVKLLQKEIKSDELCKVKILHNCCKNENYYSKIFNYEILKFKSKADFRQNTNKNQK